MENLTFIVWVVLPVVLSSSLPAAERAVLEVDPRRLDAETSWFTGEDKPSGAVWRWQPETGSVSVHEPWRGEPGVVVAVWPPIRLPADQPTRFVCEGKVLYEGSDGIGLSLWLREKDRLIQVQRETIPGDRQIHSVEIDLSGYAGREVALQLQVDGHGNTAFDSTELIRPRLVHGASQPETELWRMETECRTGVLESLLIDALSLAPEGPVGPGYDTARTLPEDDSLFLGAGWGWVVSPEGLATGRDLQRRFPGVNVVLSATWTPQEISLGRQAFLRALRQAGIFFQMQHSSGLGWLNTQQELSYQALREADGLVRNWQGEQGNWLVATNPAVIEALQRELDLAWDQGRINDVKQIDYVWPWQGGRWGYDSHSVRAFREDLREEDEGLEILRDGGRTETVHFWDYFEDYRGVRFSPADLGLTSWEEYVPETEQRAAPGTIHQKRNLAVFIGLYHYEWLRQVQRWGRWEQARGGAYGFTLNPEDLGNGGDYLYLARLAATGTPFYEYFGSPSNTQGAYYHLPTYRRQAAAAGKRLGLISELGMGGHGHPYKDPAVGYVQAYDLTAAGFDDYHNEWLDEAPFAALVDPTPGNRHYARYGVYLGEAAGYRRARLDGAHRSPAPVISVSQRSVLHYMDSFLWGVRNMDSLLSVLADLHVEVEETDPLGLERLGDQARVLFYTPPFTRSQDLQPLAEWLNQPEHALVTHSYIPLSVDPGADVYLQGYQEAVVYRGEEEGQSYADWLRPQIEGPVRPAIEGFASAKWVHQTVQGQLASDRATFVPLLTGLPAIELDQSWVLPDCTPLVTVGSTALLSEVSHAGPARLFYLHCRPQQLPPEVLTALVLGLARDLDLPFQAEPELHHHLLHRYRLRTAAGEVAVVWNREVLEKIHYASGYTDELSGDRGGKPYRGTCYEFPQPGATCNIQLRVAEPGNYRIFSFLTHQEELVPVGEERILPLELRDGLAGIFYFAPDTASWRVFLKRVQAWQEKFHEVLTIRLPDYLDRE